MTTVFDQMEKENARENIERFKQLKFLDYEHGGGWFLITSAWNGAKLFQNYSA